MGIETSAIRQLEERQMFRKNEDYKRIEGDGWNPFNRRYKLLRDYTFDFMEIAYTIPAGYEWDGPTGVPIVRWITEGWLEPSLRHDWLYEKHFDLTRTHIFTQQDVDDKFIYDLGNSGVGWMSRFIIDNFYAKRVFKRYYDAAEPVKISFPFLRDVLIATVATIAFVFLVFKFQSVAVAAFLGLF